MAKKLYGTDPDQVPTNADLGTMAYQDAENPRLNNVVISGSPNDDAYGTLLRVKRGPSESGTWATVAIEAQTANGNSRIAFVNDIEPSAADAHGMIDFEHQTNQMQFFVDGSEAAHFNASGNLVFPNGQGIDFSASEGSGASSSVLTDYEEGTWTPALKFGGATTGITYARAEGKYTKIGNVVHIIGHFLLTNKGTATGHAEVSGLPFTCNSNTNGAFTPLGDRGNLNTGGEGVSAYLQNSASVFLYRGGFDGGNNETVTNSHFENNTEIDLNFSYIAS